MSGIIDYAGLFPPAGLDMDTSIKNYAGYRKSPDADMLSNFIVPAGRLHELLPYAETIFGDSPPFGFSVLCKGGGRAELFTDEITVEFEKIRSFRRQVGTLARVNVLEIRLPDNWSSQDEIREILDRTARLINAYIPDEVNVFYEITLEHDWRLRVENLMAALIGHNEENAGGARYLRGGYKLRCGGVEASMFPDPEQVSAAIHHCVSGNVPFKGTAGLHHPFRHFDKGIGTMMHGFVNVFGAYILAATYNLSEAHIREIIEDENPDNFEFDDRFFSWKNMKVTVDIIENVRKDGAVSFGSCSFDEPREDLRELGLME